MRLGDAARLLLAWAVSALALGVAGALVPGLWADTPWAYVGAALVAGLVGVVVRPVLVEVSVRIGWLAVLLLALVGQAVVMQVALETSPGMHSDSFATTFVVAWVAAAVATGLSWLTTAGTDEAYDASLRRRAVRSKQELADPELDGILFVQIDGVAYPVLQWALAAGTVPTMRRWLHDGDYVLNEWTPQLPCTTPASQLGILHGSVDQVPAFRWYDRELGRLVVANRPADAALIEARGSDGRGLLADDGISVSNLFSGDAERSAMTMSRLALSRGSVETRRAVAWYLARPDGFARSLTRTLAEIVKERFQAGRQHRRDLRPRVHRGWTFAGLRAFTNAILRDLNTAVVSDEMLRGTKAIYVDYVDYDEIAHHAGMFRPESLAALEGLDGVLASLARVATHAPRRYRIVVLSDHGQSQGDTFAQRHGSTLAETCEALSAASVAAVEDAVEGWGRAESVLDDLGGESGVTSRATGGVAKRVRTRVGKAAPEASAGDELVVLGSGNLGLVYATPAVARLDRHALDARWPSLVSGLAGHPGVGFVVVEDSTVGPLVLGAHGQHELRSGQVHGVDPLLGFPDHAATVIARAMSMPEAPDIYVNSVVDPGTADVAAFEPLVGCHGGLGGWQDRALLLAPADLLSDGDLPLHGRPLIGADRLHELLVRFLERSGHRSALAVPS